MTIVADESPSGPRHGDQARDFIETISDLEHTLWAFQGLSDVLDPDHTLEGQSRANVSTLISLLTERLETLLGEVTLRWRNTPAPVAAPPQEGDQHGMP